MKNQGGTGKNRRAFWGMWGKPSSQFRLERGTLGALKSSEHPKKENRGCSEIGLLYISFYFCSCSCSFLLSLASRYLLARTRVYGS
jgi:hypothetical protein